MKGSAVQSRVKQSGTERTRGKQHCIVTRSTVQHSTTRTAADKIPHLAPSPKRQRERQVTRHKSGGEPTVTNGWKQRSIRK